jgi:hypothetical protein
MMKWQSSERAFGTATNRKYPEVMGEYELPTTLDVVLRFAYPHIGSCGDTYRCL